MKRILLYLFITGFIACNENEMSHTETAEIVAGSFYHNDTNTQPPKVFLFYQTFRIYLLKMKIKN